MIRSADADGNEERYVVVDGQAILLVRVDTMGEWLVYYAADPPGDAHPQIGSLVWEHVPGATYTTGLGVFSTDSDELLRRVALAAGLDVRPPRARLS